jgi:hypothetical protein
VLDVSAEFSDDGVDEAAPVVEGVGAFPAAAAVGVLPEPFGAGEVEERDVGGEAVGFEGGEDLAVEVDGGGVGLGHVGAGVEAGPGDGEAVGGEAEGGEVGEVVGEAAVEVGFVEADFGGVWSRLWMWPGLACPGWAPVPVRFWAMAARSKAVQSEGCWVSICWSATATPHIKSGGKVQGGAVVRSL